MEKSRSRVKLSLFEDKGTPIISPRMPFSGTRDESRAIEIASYRLRWRLKLLRKFKALTTNNSHYQRNTLNLYYRWTGDLLSYRHYY